MFWLLVNSLRRQNCTRSNGTPNFQTCPLITKAVIAVAAGVCVEAEAWNKVRLTLTQVNTRAEWTRWSRAACLYQPAPTPAKHWAPGQLSRTEQRLPLPPKLAACSAGWSNGEANHSWEPNSWWHRTASIYVTVVYYYRLLGYLTTVFQLHTLTRWSRMLMLKLNVNILPILGCGVGKDLEGNISVLSEGYIAVWRD